MTDSKPTVHGSPNREARVRARLLEAFEMARALASRQRDVDFDAAEDIASEVQQSVLNNTLADPEFLDAPGELERFVLIATRNALMYRRRSESNRRVRETAHEIESNERDHQWMQADPDDEAEEAFAELSEAIDRALARTPPQRRRAWLLVHVEDLSYEEAAARLGIPVRTLESRNRVTKKKLREELDRYRKERGA
jgi:RNA polymerase sigma factor (sigma-70 family)